MHHIVIDGLSFDHFVNELSNYYNSKYYKSSVSTQDQVLKISALSDVLVKSYQFNVATNKLFWQEKLLDSEPIDLSFLRLSCNDPIQDTFDWSISELTGIGELRFNFDQTVLLKLDRLKEKCKITPYLFSQSIFALLLYKYTGQNNFGISYPVAIKQGKDFLYGVNVNTNIIPYDFSQVNNILDLINQSKAFIQLLKLVRNDFQVKIREYRIKLGEIETVLLGYQGVKQSVVLAKKHRNIEGDLSSNSNKYLVRYYVADAKLDEATIFHYLQSKLPEYMVPAVFVQLDKLPLTINGKLDRKALPDPEFTSQDNYIAPRNEIERKVSQIWAEVLGLDTAKVGIQDDSFRLREDSIVSIQLVSRLRQRIGLNDSVKDIFSYKNIASLYDHVLSKDNNTLLKVQTEQGILVGEVPLLPVQQWFFAHNFITSHHWNQSLLIKTLSLDLDKLQKSLVKLAQFNP